MRVPTVFTKNRDPASRCGRWLGSSSAELLNHKKVRELLSDEHFSVDGTQIQAWASMKSFRPKDGSGEPPDPGRNGERDFRGEKPSNDTHASTTDPEAKLHRKGAGKEAKLSFMGRALMGSRSGLVVEAELTKRGRRPGGAARPLQADDGAVESPGAGRRLTLGAGEGYGASAFVAGRRVLNVARAWHIAQEP